MIEETKIEVSESFEIPSDIQNSLDIYFNFEISQNKKIVELWLKNNLDLTGKLLKNSKKLVKEISNEESRRKHDLRIIREVRYFYQDLSRLAKSVYANIKNNQSELWENWQNELSIFSEQLPETVQLEIFHSEWVKKSVALKNGQIWRFYNTIKQNLGNKKEPEQKTNLSIPLKDGLTAIYSPEFQYQRWLSWTQLLYFSADILDSIQTSSLLIKDSYTFLADKKKSDKDDIIIRHKELIDKLNEFIQKLNELVTNINAKAETTTDELNKYVKEKLFQPVPDWLYAGSPVIPARILDKDVVSEKISELSLKNKQSYQRCLQIIDGRRDEWQKDIELTLLLTENVAQAYEVIYQCNSRIDNRIVKSTGNSLTAVQKSREKIKELGNSQSSFIKDVGISGKEIISHLQTVLMPQMIQSIVYSNLEGWINSYSYELKKSILNLPDKQTIFFEKRNQLGQHIVDHAEVEFKEIIKREILIDIVKIHKSFFNKVQDLQKTIIREISELDHLLEVNIDAGLMLMEDDTSIEREHEALNVIIEGYSRLENRIEELTQKVTDLKYQIVEVVEELASDFKKRINELMSSEKINELRIRHVRALARERLQKSIIKAINNLKHGIGFTLKLIPMLLLWGQRRVTKFRQLTGIEQELSASSSWMHSFILETDQKIKDLPFVYQQLFRNLPLTDERFFSCRDGELEQLIERYDSWRSNHLASCAIVGERGIGTTTLLNMASTRVFNNEKVISISLESTITSEKQLVDLLIENFSLPGTTDTLDGIENLLAESEIRHICILENIQKLYLRCVDGFDILEKFLIVISRTSAKILWILTCNKFAWNYLEKVLNISGYLQKVIFLNELDAKGLEEIIVKRHQVSGFSLSFLDEEPAQKTGIFNRNKDKLQMSQELFFKKLNNLTGGNISAALLFYLRSITKHEGSTLYLSSNFAIEKASLQGLSTEERFTLAALVQHGNLTQEEDARIFRRTVFASKRIFVRMVQRGLIIETDYGYRIHSFLYRLVVRDLKNRNLLH